ncbi:NifA subfamily transcriptional regulator [Chitinivibrio alkaliphilus ACht1]|uniref:NifA subfamily transcriptional regulator n=2 Tax=Chitinivibrio TaxID=1505231 RepID=U7D7N7_9BACT|nr:NifA subfamily transcriptional regulator [Chitinivibrio alkaliphilus ACht1]
MDGRDFSLRQLQILFSISRELSSGNALSVMLDGVIAILEQEAGFERGTIAILKASGRELAIDISRGLSPREIEKGWYSIGEGVLGRVAETGTPALIPRIAEDPSFLDKTGARREVSLENLSFLCVPITSRGKNIGTLSCDRPASDDESLLNKDLLFLQAVADLIGRVVQARRKQKAELEALERENRQLKKHLSERADAGRSDRIIGNSSAMAALYTQIAQVAPLDTLVLIRGETGTGKELVARTLHEKSARQDKPFVAVNCAAIPETLLESELFGHTKGAFTGAAGSRRGFFEEAEGGTLFLDEIGDMSSSAQSRLLRVIQEKEMYTVGSSRPRKIDVRLICATNKNLEEAVQAGNFREDLYYRINVMSLFIPPLRDRGADILLLADYFIETYARRHEKKITRLSTPAIEMLSAYHWPGNVRELENVIERAVIVSFSSVIDAHDLPPSLQMKEKLSAEAPGQPGLAEKIAVYEKELIIDALKDARGNQAEAARLLHTTKRVIQYKITKYGIAYKKFRTGGA